MSIVLPISPHQETIKMLIKAKHFLEHAKQHAVLDNDFDIMISIHNLDNAIEYMLRILIRHLDIEEATGQTISTCELAQLIGIIQKFLRDSSAGVSLSYVQEIKMIRELRNMVQHAMILPIKELESYLIYGEKFFEKSLEKFFGLSINEVSYGILIKNDFIKDKIILSENKCKEGNYLETVVACRDAFNYANFIYNNDFLHRIERAPAFAEIKDSHNNLFSYLKTIDDRISMNAVNVDIKKYLHFLKYIDCIPREYQEDWHSSTVLQRPWEKSDADFCYNFVTNTILQWEIEELPSIINHTENDSTFPPVKFIERIEGINITERFAEYGCHYFLGDCSARLFYVNKDGWSQLKPSLEKRILKFESERYVAQNMNLHISNYKSIKSYDINLKMHDPAIWEVIIRYEDIPFTHKDLMHEEGVNIDIATKQDLLLEGLSPQTADTILNFLRSYKCIDCVGTALELYDKIDLDPNTINANLYSAKLLEHLSSFIAEI